MMNRRRTLLCAAASLMAAMAIPYAVFSQTIPPLTLADALQIIDAAQKEAALKNYRLSVAVVDARGDVIALTRMPQAEPSTADTAMGRAMASAIFGRSSGSLIRMAESVVGQGVNNASGGRLRFSQGALPIVRGGFTVGAVAASGATTQQDEDTVRIALAATMR